MPCLLRFILAAVIVPQLCVKYRIAFVVLHWLLLGYTLCTVTQTLQPLGMHRLEKGSGCMCSQLTCQLASPKANNASSLHTIPESVAHHPQVGWDWGKVTLANID